MRFFLSVTFIIFGCLATNAQEVRTKSQVISDYIRGGWSYTDLMPAGDNDHVTIVGAVGADVKGGNAGQKEDDAKPKRFFGDQVVVYAFCVEAFDSEAKGPGVRIFGSHIIQQTKDHLRLRTGVCHTYSNPIQKSIVVAKNTKPIERDVILFYKFLYQYSIPKGQ